MREIGVRELKTTLSQTLRAVARVTGRPVICPEIWRLRALAT